MMGWAVLQHLQGNLERGFQARVYAWKERLGDRHIRWLLVGHLVWLLTLACLVSWWARLVARQAQRIALLEGALGMSSQEVAAHGQRVQRMLFWESGAFFFLLLISTGILLWWGLRDRIRSRGIQAFFASVSHELKTPLTGIRLQAEALSELNMGGGEVLTRRLLEDAQRLESWVERTLTLARVEGGGTLYLQPVPFAVWWGRFLRSWQAGFPPEQQPQVRFDGEAAPSAWILADLTALSVIFRNLMENALKHGRPAAASVPFQVRCSLRRVQQKSLWPLRAPRFFERRASREWIEVCFEDQGSGFAGDVRQLGRLFQKGPTSQGSGVGLYLVQALMHQMGGQVEWRGEPASGFQVKLLFQEVDPDGHV
jgi:signal transduction histidine kinase